MSKPVPTRRAPLDRLGDFQDSVVTRHQLREYGHALDSVRSHIAGHRRPSRIAPDTVVAQLRAAGERFGFGRHA
jgi:hypothetical protein